jgi:hypothetical protein
MNINQRLIATLIAPLSIAITGTSTLAASVTASPDNPSLATGIEDLEVGGIFYDVDFVSDSFLSLFGEPSQPNFAAAFFGNEAGAKSAVDAINALLTDAGISLVGDGSVLSIIYLVPYGVEADGVNGENILTRRGFLFLENPGFPAQWVQSTGDVKISERDWENPFVYATFNPAPRPVTIPEYSSASALALIALAVGLGRGKKKTVDD